jgi:shikimate kinase
MKVYLVGMPGSGKTTFGKQLAANIGLPFIDLDAEIEKAEKKKIPEIFSTHGEAYFRRVESALLHQWANSKKEFIMATGGGAPCFHSGMELINRTGVSIFLDVSINEIMARLQNNTDRPMLQDFNREQTLLEIAKVRLPVYRQARIITQFPIVEEILSEIHFKK